MTSLAEHKLLRRGRQAYEAARRAAVWRANKPPRFPEAIVLAENQDDVVAAVRLARREGLKVTVRSGGHSWNSPHVRDGALLIDVSRLDHFSIDARARTAWAGPGTKGRRLNQTLAPAGLLFPGGHHNTVGLGGFVMCGGFGWNAREWGNGCTNVLAIEAVTADGERIYADATQNSDWYWAARGSGAGFFGVVTRFLLQLHPLPKYLRHNALVFGLDELEPALTWAREIIDVTPRNVEVVATASSFDDAGNRAPTRLTIGGLTFANDEAEVKAAEALFDSCPVAGRALLRRRSAETTLMERYDGATRADPEGFRFACDNLYTNAGAAEVVPLMRGLFGELPTPRSHVFWQNWGPVRELPDMALSVQADLYLAVYTVWDRPEDDERLERWPVEQMRRLEHLSVGGQMNDENMLRRPARYLSEAAEARLESLRARHDPHGLFLSYLV
ncbi:MAG: FAD-binding oxidoreductase [Solimonas sp.]